MGPESAFTVVIHRQNGGSSVIDFRDYDVAVRFAKDRAATPLVARVEIVHDHRMVWSDAKGVIPEHQH